MGIIRALLAIAVVFAHSPWNDGFIFTGGQAAVQCFYLISGFVISYVLTSNKNYSSTWRFYLNRFLRLYPTYFVVAFVSLFFAIRYDQGFQQIFQHGPRVAKGLLVCSNLALFGQDWVMFTAIHNGALYFSTNFRESDIAVYAGLLLPQAWSLGVELTFYLLAPFLLRKRKWLLGALTISFIVRLCLIILGVGFQDPWSYRFFPAELGLFLAGSLSQQLLTPLWKKWVSRFMWLPKIGTAVCAGFTVVYFLIPLPEPYLLPIYLAVSFLLLPLLFEFQNESWFDRWIGQFSYPIYIGHSLVERVFHICLPKVASNSDIFETMANVVLSILLAFLLHNLIEKRIEPLRDKVRSVGSPPVSSILDLPQTDAPLIKTQL